MRAGDAQTPSTPLASTFLSCLGPHILESTPFPSEGPVSVLAKAQRIKQGSGKGQILFATLLYSTPNHSHIHALTLETHGCHIKLIASLINACWLSTISRTPGKSSRKNHKGQAAVKNFQVRRHMAAICMTDRASTVYCGHRTWPFPFLLWDFQESRWHAAASGLSAATHASSSPRTPTSAPLPPSQTSLWSACSGSSPVGRQSYSIVVLGPGEAGKLVIFP